MTAERVDAKIASPAAGGDSEQIQSVATMCALVSLHR